MMKGSIFRAFESFVESGYGDGMFDELIDRADLATRGPFVGPGNYPAGDLVALVVCASEVLDTGVEDLLRAFGRFAFSGLASSVPGLLEGISGSKDFLLRFESIVHTEVRKLDPDARPARFYVEDVGGDSLLLHYESDLGLFDFVLGMLDGVGDWFGDSLTGELVDVDGTSATFRVDIAEALVEVT
jgi:hypothetical protein